MVRMGRLPKNAYSLYLSTIFSTVVAPLSPAGAGSDHHMHIHSEDAGAAWAEMCAEMPGECSEAELVPLPPLGAHDAIAALDTAGLDKGVVLSLAYFFGAPELAATRYNDARYVRAENDYVAGQVDRFPDRLIGFFSVNPLAEYALDEVRFWAGRAGLAGLKLHLANADFDFGNPSHVQKLRAVVDVMNEHRLPVVLHLRNRAPDYGYRQAAKFIDDIARHAPEVTFQLAHLAGWGGYDHHTDGAVQAFLDAIDSGALDRSRIWFDLAAVVESTTPDTTLTQLVIRLRDIGIDRLLIASDWDETDLKTYVALLKDKLDLSDAEWRQLISNEAPYVLR